MEIEIKMKNEEDMFEFKSVVNKGKIEYIDARKILNIIKPEVNYLHLNRSGGFY